MTDKPPTPAEMGRKGGKRSLETMTPQQRSDRARKASQAVPTESRRKAAVATWERRRSQMEQKGSK